VRKLWSTHIDDPHAVGERLRRVREEAGISQRRLAFEGCTPAYISRIEAGQRVPSIQILGELARRLGVSPEYLATGSEPSVTEEALTAAEVALRLDDVGEAERLYRDALATADDDPAKAAAIEGLGQVRFRLGDPKAAVDDLQAAYDLFGDQASNRASLVDTLGRAHAMLGEPELAAGLFRRALEAAEQRDDFVDRMRFTVLLANALIDSGLFAEAESLLGRALSLAAGSDDPLLVARLYWSQSRLRAERGDSKAAAEYASKALVILELTEHTEYTARAHQLLAHIEIDRGRPAEALELLDQAWRMIEDTGNDLDHARLQLERARALARLDRREEAASLAMRLAGRISEADPVDAGRSYALLAETFEQLGDEYRARELYELAAEFLERAPNRYLVGVYGRLAELLEQAGRKDEAFDLLKKAVAIQTTTGIRRGA